MGTRTSYFLKVSRQGRRKLKGARNVSRKVSRRNGGVSLKECPFFYICALHVPHFHGSGSTGGRTPACAIKKGNPRRARCTLDLSRVLCNRNRGASRVAAVAVERKGRNGKGGARHFSDTPGLHPWRCIERCIPRSGSLSFTLFATPSFITKDEGLPKRDSPLSVNFCVAYWTESGFPRKIQID